MKLRWYTWVEFFIWFIILSICIWGFRFHKYEKLKELPTYQIFMPDVDGMIVGSPVKYMGVQIGYIKNIKILSNNSVYVKFVITDKELHLPKGVIATVEFSGLGGSKSLELYPPDGTKTDKLIVVNTPTRLSDSIGLFNDMFGKIDAITAKFSHFANQMGVIDFSTESLEFNPDDIGKSIKQTDDFFEGVLKKREELKNKYRGNNE